ncbi:MAG: sulfate ABC transporter ATP-binding protein [Betaproteobacteria bacterium]|nr:sulfate ABC transporter ATP-binding protein [Betaproteobacteria bacterium]
MSIQVRNVSKNFGNFSALNGVSLDIEPGELVALLGPSGSGKTTLLRVIAGLERPDSGQIYFSGEDTTETRVQEREVGFVFQHYALFRHMTIFENVAFGLRVRPRKERPAEAEVQERVHKLLNLVQLDWLADRYPHQLSGGQRQRIALARALAIEPKVLLLDEPFGALDAKVRKELRRWLRRLHDEINLTSVFVTHDQEEALEVADRIVVVNQGKIEQVGTPEAVYDHPATAFVYQFLGNVNQFHGRVRRGIATFGSKTLAAPEHETVEDAAATAYVRPHDIDIARAPGIASMPATVSHALRVGPVVRLELSRDDNGELVEVEVPRERFDDLGVAAGNVVHLTPRRAKVFLETPHAAVGARP